MLRHALVIGGFGYKYHGARWSVRVGLGLGLGLGMEEQEKEEEEGAIGQIYLLL